MKKESKVFKKTKKFWKDFGNFINKGNIFDLAIAVIIGTAFNKIISSFVNDLIMPTFSLILGKVSFKDLKIVITSATETTAEVAINYGAFIQSIVDFLIIALCIFIAFRIVNSSKQKLEAEAIKKGYLSKETPAGPVLSPTEKLLTEIRDELKEQKTIAQPNQKTKKTKLKNKTEENYENLDGKI